MVIEDSNLAKEILMILPYIDNNYLKVLSWDFINNLKDLAVLSTKEFYFDDKKSLKEMTLSEACKDFLGLLYFNECNSKEKQKLIEIWNLNEM